MLPGAKRRGASSMTPSAVSFWASRRISIGWTPPVRLPAGWPSNGFITIISQAQGGLLHGVEGRRRPFHSLPFTPTRIFSESPLQPPDYAEKVAAGPQAFLSFSWTKRRELNKLETIDKPSEHCSHDVA